MDSLWRAAGSYPGWIRPTLGWMVAGAVIAPGYGGSSDQPIVVAMARRLEALAVATRRVAFTRTRPGGDLGPEMEDVRRLRDELARALAGDPGLPGGSVRAGAGGLAGDPARAGAGGAVGDPALAGDHARGERGSRERERPGNPRSSSDGDPEASVHGAAGKPDGDPEASAHGAGKPAGDVALSTGTGAAASTTAEIPIALVGRSFGGRVCTRLAVLEPPRALVLLGHPIAPPRRPRPLDEAALEAVSCPTLIVQGEKDTLGPLAVLERIARVNRQLTLYVLPGVGHQFGARQNDGLDHAAAWLAEQLGLANAR